MRDRNELILADLESVRKRRPTKHRRRRDRRPQAGQMILWDGSRHDWLEGRGPRLCLMGAIDDATGEVLPGSLRRARVFRGYLRVLRDTSTVHTVAAWTTRNERRTRKRAADDGVTE